MYKMDHVINTETGGRPQDCRCTNQARHSWTHVQHLPKMDLQEKISKINRIVAFSKLPLFHCCIQVVLLVWLAVHQSREIEEHLNAFAS
jgi:hypothetical protein